jgi:hypothetical protein
LVCGDVIEHLVHPENLLALLRRGLDDGAVALLLTTPERERTQTPGNLGPPPNPAHSREWALEELRAFMASEQLPGYFGLTRSNDVSSYMRTILAVVPGRSPAYDAIVREWFEERAKWQATAEQQDAVIANLERSAKEVQEAYDRIRGQLANWQAIAAQREESIGELKEWIEQLEARLDERGTLWKHVQHSIRQRRAR